MLSALYLWTTQVKPETFVAFLKKDLCFSYDSLKFEKEESKETDKQNYKLTFDFGDMQIEYKLVFNHSKETNRWVLSEINM